MSGDTSAFSIYFEPHLCYSFQSFDRICQHAYSDRTWTLLERPSRWQSESFRVLNSLSNCQSRWSEHTVVCTQVFLSFLISLSVTDWN